MQVGCPAPPRSTTARNDVSTVRAVMHEPALAPENPAPRGRLSAAVAPGAPVNDLKVTQHGAAAEPAATAVVRAPAVLPRAGAPARPGTGRRRHAPDRQVAASPGPVVQGSTVETQQRPDTERNRDCPACPRSARFASWTKGHCMTSEYDAARRAAPHMGRAGAGPPWPCFAATTPSDRPTGSQTSNLPRARAANCSVTRGPWSLVRSSCPAGERCARVRCHAGRCRLMVRRRCARGLVGCADGAGPGRRPG